MTARWGLLFGLGALLLAPQLVATEIRSAREEVHLVSGLRALQENRFDEAIEAIGRLTETQPDFRLAQAIYGDLLMARAGQVSLFGGERGEIASDLLSEARSRWSFGLSAEPARLPASLLRLGDGHRHAIVVDLERARLYLYENAPGRPRLIADYYASHGKNGASKQVEGDKRTPLGIYRVVERLSASGLPDRYGAGALPIDYPNPWDRRLGRTGYGIWVHGTPVETYSRPPQASDGCVALTNPDFAELDRLVEVGSTPVIITERVEWLAAEDWSARHEAFAQVVEGWRQAWATLDTEAYLAHYAEGFTAPGFDRDTWAAHKRRVNAAKSFVDLEIRNLSIFAYPGEEEMIAVTFEQDYRSDNYVGISTKRQYWRRIDGRWQIVYEGQV